MQSVCARVLEGQIEYDCKHSIDCKVLQGTVLPRAAMMQECLNGGISALSISTVARAQFLASFGRCSRLSGCDYDTCAKAGVTGFGEMQRASVTYNCQQTMDCKAARGMPVCLGDQALVDCASFTVGQLNNMTPAEQQNYVSASARCASLTGCAFVDCLGAVNPAP